MSKDSRQVYSSDANLNRKCPKCKELLAECQCQEEAAVDLKKINPVLSLEKAGRGGKTVTVLSQLPKSASFLKELLSQLKQKCGAGGTFSTEGKRGGIIELQGDQRQAIHRFLTEARDIS